MRTNDRYCPWVGRENLDIYRDQVSSTNKTTIDTVCWFTVIGGYRIPGYQNGNRDCHFESKIRRVQLGFTTPSPETVPLP